MRTATIALSAEENALLDQIHFDAAERDALAASLAPMAELTERLLQRDAISHNRLRYFTDPECNPGGRGKSRADVFEANGTQGDEILRHPHFMKYLAYFLFGPDLPEAIIAEFNSRASMGGHLDAEDVTDFIPRAKAFVRRPGAFPPRRRKNSSSWRSSLARRHGQRASCVRPFGRFGFSRGARTNHGTRARFSRVHGGIPSRPGTALGAPGGTR